MHDGRGNSLKYLKRGWNRTEGRGHKDFKKVEGQAGSRGGCLKNGGGGEAGTPIQTVVLNFKTNGKNTLLILFQLDKRVSNFSSISVFTSILFHFKSSFLVSGTSV